MAKGKKKAKKDRKGKKRVPRGLPTPVKGLLQYLGGQDATLQQGSRPRGATPSDVGETLSRYLSAKTATLDLQKQQLLGINLAQQREAEILAKRQAEEAEKKISMLSAGLKESDVERKKAIAEQKSKISELQSVVQSQQQESLYRDIMERKARAEARESLFKIAEEQSSLPSSAYRGAQTPSIRSGVPFWSGIESQYSFKTQEEGDDFETGDPSVYSEDFGTGGGGAVVRGGGGVASELYMEQAPTGRPVIRDRPRREPRMIESGSLPRRTKAPAPEKTKTQITADQLRKSISEATGLAKSKYKLPPRKQYATVQSALQRQSANPADIISALKEAGVNIEQA